MEKRQHRQKEVLMTEGPIWRCLLLFALPLMAGNLFQQLYNTVDSIVVGNFVGKEALAAVGSTDSVINTFIGFFSGMSTGAGVIISQYYGGKKEEKVSVAVQTTIALTLCMSILCTVLALLLVPSLLRLMGTPEDVFPEAATYLRIYFIGVTGLLFYNMGAGILRAVGDSRRPLYFLIFCAVLNTLLDLLFVAVLRFGIAGAAWATILSQGISALLTLFVLTREKACYRIIWSKVRLDPGMTKKIFFLGLPAAIQMAVTSFSNVFVQAYINRFGSAAMAGWSSYGKIDKFCVLPIQSLSLGVTTFVGQNYGAGKIQRVKKSVYICTGMDLVTSIGMTLILFIFRVPLFRIFTTDAAVVEIGVSMLEVIAPCYTIFVFIEILSGALRGMSDVLVPMFMTMFGICILRIVWIFFIVPMNPTLKMTILNYPVTWILTAVLFIIYYLYKTRRMKA